MARWLCNSPLPGTYLQSRGIIKPGQEFTTPDDPKDPFFARAQESWVPLDSGAEKLVAQAKKDSDKFFQQRAEENARRREMEDNVKNGVNPRPFETKEYEPNQTGVGRNKFADVRLPTEEEQERNEAWTKQVRKEQKKDESPETLAVQGAVREQIALAGGAAAQPVPDPGDLTASTDKDRASKGSKK